MMELCLEVYIDQDVLSFILTELHRFCRRDCGTCLSDSFYETFSSKRIVKVV